MGLFDRIKGPVFLKTDSSARDQLCALEELLEEAVSTKTKALIESDMAALHAGIIGEDRILFELKNSHIPMFVLHDVYLEQEGLSAQIDFLIITRRRNFVIECKNLYGDIMINNAGDFVRTIGNHKEGIYSPITQSKRHLELIRQIRRMEQNNLFKRTLFDSNFYSNYRSVVVLANPKTVLNAKYASKEIKNQVIRADQLIEYIKKVNKEEEAIDSSESAMEQLANFFLAAHKPCKTDYLEKYRQMIRQEKEAASEAESIEIELTAPKSFRAVNATTTTLPRP